MERGESFLLEYFFFVFSFYAVYNTRAASLTFYQFLQRKKVHIIWHTYTWVHIFCYSLSKHLGSVSFLLFLFENNCCMEIKVMCIIFSSLFLGVPATSRILTGDSQKLSFSILTKVPFLIFWSDEPPRHANSAHVACSRAGMWAAWAEVARRRGVSYIDKIYIFEILMRNCSKYQSPSQIGWFFSKWAPLVFIL